jgi:hypothetical protein
LFSVASLIRACYSPQLIGETLAFPRRRRAGRPVLFLFYQAAFAPDCRRSDWLFAFWLRQRRRKRFLGHALGARPPDSRPAGVAAPRV